jgi:hypothetical protein
VKQGVLTPGHVHLLLSKAQEGRERKMLICSYRCTKLG